MLPLKTSWARWRGVQTAEKATTWREAWKIGSIWKRKDNTKCRVQYHRLSTPDNTIQSPCGCQYRSLQSYILDTGCHFCLELIISSLHEAPGPCRLTRLRHLMTGSKVCVSFPLSWQEYWTASLDQSHRHHQVCPIEQVSGISASVRTQLVSLASFLTFFSSKLFLSGVFHFIPPFSSPCPAVCCGYICLVWSRPWWPTLEVLAPLIPAMCAKNSWCHWTRYSPGSPCPFHGRILWSWETVNMRWVHSRNRRREEKSSWEEGAVWRHLDASLLFYNPVIKYSRKKT